MRGLLLILAAAAAVSVPASAFPPSRPDASVRTSGGNSAFVRIHRGHSDFVSDRARRDRNRGDVFFPYRDYQGDTLWRPDIFNDWWHDRPDRAFPRWVASNPNCQRQYWAGGGWRC
jgi:hypothetical protein